jgi:BlaI family transcriptional regulator, penicillinase repressor
MRVLGLLGAAEPQSVSDVKDALAREGNDLAYTTVMTVMRRLHEKGLLTRKKDARRHLYSANKRATHVKEGLVSRVHRALFRNQRIEPLLTLVQREDISRDELEALRSAIDERLKERKLR